MSVFLLFLLVAAGLFFVILVALLCAGYVKNVDIIGMKGKIVAVVEGPEGKRVYTTNNIITNDGDVFYAQKGAGETPTNAFTNLFLGSKATPTISKASNFSSITLIANTEKALSAGYPKTNETDPNNEGNGGPNIITYKYEYGKADFNAPSITEGVIAVTGASGNAPVLCHFAFTAPFEKTANDTLVVFVNHKIEGV